ncbi:VOC family protein [Ammoniphilus sp. YIM 78166]|uniref:VOC family protein n=1 Tax=Ammoniphilus sp. YIM 78166 TaxID=1644106 RepID=UPI00106FDD72|nr:VOC family protein [Ammoniphilus sp. YIM 78166]
MLRYKKLGYVALNVTDLKRSKDFYRDLVGIQPVDESREDIAYYRTSSDHHNVILCQDKEPGLRRIALEMEDADMLETAFEQFTKAGLNPTEVSNEEAKQLNQGKTFRIQDPFGITFEFYSDIVYLPTEFQPTHTNILRLGHVVLKSKTIHESVKFYNQVMNFKISDVVDDGIGAFMRCFPISYHHSFAVFRGEEHGLHHVNFMVNDIDDIGKARNRFIRHDVPIVFGPGRHTPSGAIFLYYLDPDGMTVEYSFGMEEFPEVGARKPRLLEASLETIDMWGGVADPRLASMGSVGGK